MLQTRGLDVVHHDWMSNPSNPQHKRLRKCCICTWWYAISHEGILWETWTRVQLPNNAQRNVARWYGGLMGWKGENEKSDNSQDYSTQRKRNCWFLHFSAMIYIVHGMEGSADKENVGRLNIILQEVERRRRRHGVQFERSKYVLVLSCAGVDNHW